MDDNDISMADGYMDPEFRAAMFPQVPTLVWKSTQDTQCAILGEKLAASARPVEKPTRSSLFDLYRTPSGSSSGPTLVIPGRRQKPVPIDQAPRNYNRSAEEENVFVPLFRNADKTMDNNSYAKKRRNEKQALRQAQSTEGVSIIVEDPVPQRSSSRSERSRDKSSHVSKTIRNGRTMGAEDMGDISADGGMQSPASIPPSSCSPGIVETDGDESPISVSNSKARASRPVQQLATPPTTSSSSARTSSSSSIKSNPVSRSSSSKAMPDHTTRTPAPPPPPAVSVAPTISPVQRTSQYPRPTPPALGMRRPTYNGASTLESRLAGQLPTKQRRFKPPSARPPGGPSASGAGAGTAVVQQPSKSAPQPQAQIRVSEAQEPSKSAATAHPQQQVAAPKHAPVARSRSRSYSPPLDADSSYGNLSMEFDFDTINEVMKEYD
ncbi:unnamed protein product [Somion occarium]|uniref:Uncharacterized protein n=1 Tax=Somion occarium TaxID=3059160 RepID=A0ABP1DUL6_9APHY